MAHLRDEVRRMCLSLYAKQSIRMPKKINCSIAGIPFSIYSDSNEPIQWLEENLHAFISKSHPILKFYLQHKKGIHRLSQLPEVKWEKDSFEIRLNGFCINGNIPAGKVHVQTRHRWAVGELLRTFFSIYLIKREGFLLHASCIMHKGGAYVFSGPSQSGKTTIARLASGRPVLTDESIAIVRRSGTYRAFATPFYGEFGMINKNINGKIKALFFIEKSNRFSHERLTSLNAHLELFKNIILRGRNIMLIKDLFNTFSKFTNTVPCFKLSFRNGHGIWGYLDENITPILS